MQPAHLRTHPALQTGFTLIELVVSIIITAIVIGFMIMFIATPVQAYLAQGRRASLAHEAEISMHNLDIDLRSALPNSVRYTQSGSVLAIELWPVVDVASYRDSGSLGAGNALHELDFVAADTSFSNYIAFTKITYPFVSGQHHLVVNNLGQAGANVYAMNNVITPNGSSIDR
ncbi:MAG: type II secretion system protein J, partial [Steroidobacteraceae bacterium]